MTIRHPAIRWQGVVRRLCANCAGQLLEAGYLVEDPTDQVDGLRMLKACKGFTEDDLREAALVHHANGSGMAQ